MLKRIRYYERMKHIPKVSLIIPCLNEEDGLTATLPHIPASIAEVIVVDGNSQDRSRQVAEKHQARVLVEKKRGYGLALRTGFNAASHDFIATCDADGTYPVSVLPEMLAYMETQKWDMIVGCRFPIKNPQVMTVRNFFGNLLISSFTSLFYKKHVTDVCSGMWIIRKDLWQKIEPAIQDNKWFFSNEIKIEVLKKTPATYGEYKIDLEERFGETKVGNVWTIGMSVLIQTFLKQF